MVLPDASQLIAFDTQKDFEKWMDENSTAATEIWIKFYKKASGITAMNYAEAMDVVLCYGWIDGISKSLDEKSYVQRFTPRRAKSVWSKINVGKIERLTKDNKMKTGGLKEVALAKADGRWDQAYDSPSTATVPEDFLIELEKNEKAKETYLTLNKTNKYAIIWRLQTAKKPETRQKRMEIILGMLERGEKFH